MELLVTFVFPLLSIAAGIFALIYLYFLYSFGYWKRRGVPEIQPIFPYGSSRITNRDFTIGGVSADYYKEFKRRGCRYGGIYAGPSPKLVLLDLELIKQIFTKDFAYFTGRGNYVNEKDEPIAAHLFNLDGKRWKNLRTKLTPTFTSGKMKMMFNTLVDCSEYMRDALLNKTNDVMKVKDVCARFTTDVIGSCAFGIDCNSFKDPNAEFRVIGMKVFSHNPFMRLKKFIAVAAPDFAHFIRLRLIPNEVKDFFNRVITEVLSYRENNNVRRNDFLQILLDMKNSMKVEGMDEALFNEKKYTLNVNEIIAQSFVFFIAGFDTSSSTMQFALYELARNEKIQQKARKEVDEMYEKNGGKITYEGVMELKYLSQIVDESLRKYPPVLTLTRKCEKNYPLPGTDLIVERGTLALIPIYGIQHDEDYFPNPEDFDPERFSEENKKKIPQFAYMPFGEGPRICIGLRFGQMQAKVGLCCLLRNFEFRVSPKMEPVEIDKSTFLITTKSPILLEYNMIER